MDTKSSSGLFQCFHCGEQKVVWDADFDFSDYGYEGNGIVHELHCANCGAEIQYRIGEEDTNDGK